jgi:hypothetical protein
MSDIKWRKKRVGHELDTGSLKIVILDTNIHHMGEWIMTCHPWFSNYMLAVDTEEEAKEMAVREVAGKLRELLSGLHEIFPGVYLE